MSDPDRKLARRAGRGDRGALLELYDRHRSRLFGYLVKVAGDREAAEDLFQEVWIKLMGGIETYRPGPSPFRAWLYRIATNAAVDRARREARQAAEELDAPGAEGGPPRIDLLESSEPGPERMGQAAELGRRLGRAMGSLNERQRAAVLLRHQQGLTYAEIAEALQVPEGTAKTMVHRGAHRLRTLLEEESGG